MQSLLSSLAADPYDPGAKKTKTQKDAKNFKKFAKHPIISRSYEVTYNETP